VYMCDSEACLLCEHKNPIVSLHEPTTPEKGEEHEKTYCLIEYIWSVGCSYRSAGKGVLRLLVWERLRRNSVSAGWLTWSTSCVNKCEKVYIQPSARIYRPSFHENKTKTLVFSHTKRAFLGLFSRKLGL
jgi:hypothetical protein